MKANENGEAIYDFNYQTAVMVTENKSPRGERATEEAIANGYMTEKGHKKGQRNGQRTSQETFSDEKRSQKRSNLTISEFPSLLTKSVYEAIKLNSKVKYSWLADNLGVSEATIKRAIADLKEHGYINKEHSKIKGEWQLLK